MKYKSITFLGLLFTMLVFAGLIKLGFWQLDRATQKEARLAQMAQWQAQGGQSLAKVIQLFSQSSNAANDVLVSQQGEFIKQPIFLQDNQTDKGRYGFRVLQVFKTKQHAVLVNLGWIQGDRSRQTLPDITPLQSQHHITGSVRIVETGIQLIEQQLVEEQGKVIVQQLEIEKISRLINQQLLPFVVYLDKNEAIGYKKNWQPIVMPPEKHRGYAFQWFSLAVAWLTLMGFAAIKYKNYKA